MLSLILTALLGLFCYSGPIDNRLTDVSNDFNMIVNCNDSSVSIFSGESTESLIFNDFRSSPVSKKGYNENNEAYLYSYVDFNSSSFINAMMMDLQTNYGTIEHSIAYAPCYVQVSKWANTQIYTDENNFGYVSFIDSSQVTTVTNITLNYTGRNTVNNIMYFTWTLDFYRADNTQFITWTIMAFPGFVDGSNNSHWFNMIDGIPTGLVFQSNTVSRFSEYVFYIPKLIGSQIYPYNEILINNLQFDKPNQQYYDLGYADGVNAGYQSGYDAGYSAGVSTDATASTIFTGILNVALIPVNVFLTIFNFEVFGINIAGIVSALLTISVVIIIIRFVTGKKDD